VFVFFLFLSVFASVFLVCAVPFLFGCILFDITSWLLFCSLYRNICVIFMFELCVCVEVFLLLFFLCAIILLLCWLGVWWLCGGDYFFCFVGGRMGGVGLFFF